MRIKNIKKLRRDAKIKTLTKTPYFNKIVLKIKENIGNKTVYFLEIVH